ASGMPRTGWRTSRAAPRNGPGTGSSDCTRRTEVGDADAGPRRRVAPAPTRLAPVTESAGTPRRAVSRRFSAPWLTRNVVVLSGVSLLQDAASELLYPVLPIFLTTVLGAPAAVVGLV